ncbi:hypothetical protein [Paraburkholderia ginsengisoli]|uniref:hypothetical protein n=1 Tax=Paraburkholderia ginsengisoli TaxID=311231 RepID=UPI001E3A42A6|nr:hypothetical protein [Paraburkholderia ginsengisoli]
MDCNIVSVGKRRDGRNRYWCLAHHANATAKYGVAADRCVGADDIEPSPDEKLDLVLGDFDGGVALWGSVPAVYDTTKQPMDRGIHVHARRAQQDAKDIDRTYRKLRLPLALDLLSDGWLEVDEIDSINYMVSSVFGFETIVVNCALCGFPHLDRDWFAVHPHRKHQCHGCGRHFSDSTAGIGNPLARLRELLPMARRSSLIAPRTLSISQKDYPGGVQIWGSNPAILWTPTQPEETGIHVHAFAALNDHLPEVDDTYAQVTIDGITLDATQVRTLMAQSAMPHLTGRIVCLSCPACRSAHFDVGELAFTPHTDHLCHTCGQGFRSKSRAKNVISNPFLATKEALARTAANPVRNDVLGLRPETL